MLHIRWFGKPRFKDIKSGLMTRKSAKYSCTARTTSWSSASASRSSEDFLIMLLKSEQVSFVPVLCRSHAPHICCILHTWDPAALQSDSVWTRGTVVRNRDSEDVASSRAADCLSDWLGVSGMVNGRRGVVLGEVDFMVQESGLCGGGRDNRDLQRLATGSLKLR